MPDDRAAIDLPRLRAALARLKEAQDDLAREAGTEYARLPEVFVLGAARDLPAADLLKEWDSLLALVGEAERLREACKLTMERCRSCDGDGEVRLDESDPETGADLSHYEPCWVCGPIRAALSAPDGEARPDGR